MRTCAGVCILPNAADERSVLWDKLKVADGGHLHLGVEAAPALRFLTVAELLAGKQIDPLRRAGGKI